MPPRHRGGIARPIDGDAGDAAETAEMLFRRIGPEMPVHLTGHGAPVMP
jgi:hypothetical protein